MTQVEVLEHAVAAARSFAKEMEAGLVALGETSGTAVDPRLIERIKAGMAMAVAAVARIGGRPPPEVIAAEPAHRGSA